MDVEVMPLMIDSDVNEVMDMIIVGGPAVNSVAKDLLGIEGDYDYETDALVAAAKEIDIDCLVIEDLVWAEIDDEVHLKRARDEIYPMIKVKEK